MKNVLETMIQTIRIYSQDIGMEFDKEKYTILYIPYYIYLIIKSGK